MDPNPTMEANVSSKSDGATAVVVETPGKPPADVESPPAPSVQTRSADDTPPPTSPAPSSKLEIVQDVLGRWRRKVGETAKTTEDLVGNVWQHLKTGPSFADAAMGVITQGTKVIAEGGYEKIFRETFDTLPEEQLKDSYACYLSTSAGPVRGILYLSTEKIAFSSDNPLPYKDGNKTEWSYYKVLIPLNQLRTVNPSSSKVNPAEKYIQVVSVDDHEFWYMGFVNYESAVKNLQEVMFGRELQP